LKVSFVFRIFVAQPLIKDLDMITIEQLKDVKERVGALRSYL
jgi:hypothetical protein